MGRRWKTTISTIVTQINWEERQKEKSFLRRTKVWYDSKFPEEKQTIQILEMIQDFLFEKQRWKVHDLIWWNEEEHEGKHWNGY